VNPQKLEASVAFMRDNWHLITDDESAYKPRAAERLAPVFEAAAAGDPAWPDSLRKEFRRYSQHVGWRTAGSFERYAAAHPAAVGSAVAALREPSDADRFWEAALAPVGGLSGLAEGTTQLKQPGARASIASLVLFSRDPYTYPVFRPRISGAPLQALLGEPLDERTISTRLVSYYSGLDRLRGILRDRGLRVESNLDVQGVLWVLNYRNFVWPRAKPSSQQGRGRAALRPARLLGPLGRQLEGGWTAHPRAQEFCDNARAVMDGPELAWSAQAAVRGGVRTVNASHVTCVVRCRAHERASTLGRRRVLSLRSGIVVVRSR